MPITQLACPQCGSTLSFGCDIADGTLVECMICMSTFTASNVVSLPAPEPVAAPKPSRRSARISPAQPDEVPTASIVAEPLPSMNEPASNDDWRGPDTLHGTGEEPRRDVPETVELPPAPVMETPHDGMGSPSELPPPMAVLEPIDVELVPAADVPGAASAPNDVPMAEVVVEASAPPPADPAMTSPAPATSKKKRPAKDDVPVAKPYAPPVAESFSEKPQPAPAAPAMTSPEKSQPAPARQQSRAADESGLAGRILLTVATCGLLFILTGGIVFAAWKVTRAARTGTADSDEANPGVALAGNPAAKDLGKTKSTKPSDSKKDDDDDDARDKIDDEIKQVLKRKITSQPGGAGIDLDPISSISISKNPAIAAQQKKINDAIDKGVAYLKRTQHPNGTWHPGHPVGYAAIGGLTLLECNVSPKDPAVMRAAAFVRSNVGNLDHTYQISLAILFLDRLGDSRDRPLIQGMALRLLAGQNEGGGWTYSCPPLSPPDMYKLYAFLQSHKQPNLLNPLGGGGMKTQAGIAVNPKREPSQLNDPFSQLDELILAKGIAGVNDPGSTSKPKDPGLIPPIGADPKTMPKKPAPAVKPIPPSSLPANLQNLPIVKNQGIKKGQGKGRLGAGDNSNTQFAMLALWAARRHNVPTDQALLASYQRFMNSHNGDGGWGYHPGFHTTNTMTNVGLLGLAMGHGAAPEIINLNPKNPREIVIKPALEDPSIRKGLQALSRYIGQPVEPEKFNGSMENLYFLWSVERVAMLYDLKTIGGKDWYGWGSQILVRHQNGGGDWPSGFYHGQSPPLNTCFALLFLRRSNLVQDLTNHLRLSTGIVDPQK
ncbi:MAG: hypothetical protein HYR84_14580 [Planctomycetes bacterium]|nr:hypothetical protein [Planctomycetota bacterium]